MCTTEGVPSPSPRPSCTPLGTASPPPTNAADRNHQIKGSRPLGGSTWAPMVGPERTQNARHERTNTSPKFDPTAAITFSDTDAARIPLLPSSAGLGCVPAFGVGQRTKCPHVWSPEWGALGGPRIGTDPMHFVNSHRDGRMAVPERDRLAVPFREPKRNKFVSFVSSYFAARLVHSQTIMSRN